MPRNKNKVQIKGKKRGCAVHPCAAQLGDILVIVSECVSRNRIAGASVSLKGPTPGQKKTNGDGEALFPDRQPGTYQLDVSLEGGEWKDCEIQPYNKKPSVSPNNLTTVEVIVCPTGNLKVSVYFENPVGGIHRSLVDKREVERIYTRGPASLEIRKENPHTFSKIRCGEYNVSAKVTSRLYEPDTGSHLKVKVPKGGTGEAEIVVSKKTWIRVKVHDTEKPADLPNVQVKMKLLDGSTRQMITTSTDPPVEATMKLEAGTCEIVELDATKKKELYEVVSVESD